MHRDLGRLLALAFGLIFAGSALGYGTVPSVTTERWGYGTKPGAFTSPEAAYRDRISDALSEAGCCGRVASTGSYGSCARTGPTTAHCSGAYNNYGFPGGSVAQQSVILDVVAVNAQGCPSGAVPISGQCQCSTGYKPSGNDCVPVSCPQGGSYSKTTQPDQLVPNVGPVCQGGCSAMPSSYEFASDGRIYAQWPFRYTGQVCSGATDAAGIDQTGDKGFEDPPTPCGAGLCPGSMNGQSMCVPCSGSQTTPSTKETAPKPVEPTQPGIDNVPGAQTKETTTNCTGSNCTTTTTYKDKDGNPVGTGSKEESKESFCQENPGISICKQGRFGGSCSGGSGSFQCDGDGVQCAIAVEQHRRACEWASVDQALTDKGNESMNGQAQPDGHPLKDAQTTAFTLASQIDTTNRIAGGCPTDDHFSVMGQAVVIPWSQTCDALTLLGNAIVGIGMLWAMFIVFRS